MGPWNPTLARHLEQLRLRDEYLRERPAGRPPARPALLVSATGGRALVVSVRAAARSTAN